MATIYTFIVIILVVLAVSGLIVGVSNDAVNFLNSAIGSKAAPRKVILTIASIGIIIGAVTSSGMMEIARSGVFYPSQFTFEEVMMLFLGVMFANVILLDLFNTFGLPTSTTVSLVFGLLGAAMAVAGMKIAGNDALTMSDLSKFINSGKALVIISAILVSVVLAFITGSIVMFFTRLIFTFRYEKIFRRFGSLWCGIAFTAIIYFALFNGLKGSGLLAGPFMTWATSHTQLSLLIVFVASSAVMALLQWCKVNILKATILAGTFSLALAFAGNDLVNFIGVPIAGLDSYKIISANGGNSDTLMGALMNPIEANHLFLIISGLIMVVTLWTSKKAQTVSETEINLAKQDEGTERFGSTLFSRTIVRVSLGINKWYEDTMPDSFQRAISKRFIPLRASGEHAHFDLVRASVNLTVASILISMATSLKLPLSTTYVTFMVAMGTSLADRAWGRESAVYRITGVLTVISGWFVTALVAFIIALLITLLLLWGGTVGIIVVSILCGFMFVQSTIMHKKRVAKETHNEAIAHSEADGDDVITNSIAEICRTMEQTVEIYQTTIQATFDEDRRTLRTMVRRSNDLFYEARERKYEVLPTLQSLKKDNYIDTGHYYVQVVDYLSEVTKALVHITRPCFEHIDNNHKGMSEEQVEDLTQINNEVARIYGHIIEMVKTYNFDEIDTVLEMRDALFEAIAQAIKNQLKRIKTKSTSTKASMLYLTILNETKTMVLQARNLLKSQKYFIETSQTNNM